MHAIAKLVIIQMHKRMKLRSDESSESNESDHDLEGKITLTG